MADSIHLKLITKLRDFVKVNLLTPTQLHNSQLCNKHKQAHGIVPTEFLPDVTSELRPNDNYN